MSTEANKARVRRAAETFSRERLEEYLEFYAPDARLHFLPPGLPPGREGARVFYSMFLAGFPDGRVRVEDLLAEGDQVACRFVSTGTHTGEFMGVPPTGRPVEVAGITVCRLAGDQCVERWSELNLLGLLQQIGAFPAAAGR